MIKNGWTAFNKSMSPPTRMEITKVGYMPILQATTKKRYSDTTIQRYTEPEPELEPCINHANYCLQSPRETSVKIFSGGAHIPKIFLIKSKCEKL